MRSGEVQKADKYFKGLIRTSLPDVYKPRRSRITLASHNMADYAVMALTELRQTIGNPTVFTLEMANLYRMQGKRDEMVQEYLNYITQSHPISIMSRTFFSFS